MSFEHGLKGRCRIEWNAQFASESVAGSARHDRQRRGRFDERGSHFVHGAVATPCDEQRDTSPTCGLRKLARMARPLGDVHLGIQPALLNQRGRVLRAKTSDITPPTCAGNWIDDDDDFLSRRSRAVVHSLDLVPALPICRSIFGVTNQPSDPGRLPVKPCKSIRQTPPLRNASGRFAPRRWAASSPSPGS